MYTVYFFLDNSNIASSKVKGGNQTALDTCRAGNKDSSILHNVNNNLGILRKGPKSPTLVTRLLVVQVVLVHVV